jgi:hypothetical protein
VDGFIPDSVRDWLIPAAPGTSAEYFRGGLACSVETENNDALNDRSVDTGDLAPGASSQPMAIAAAGGQYHCSIHPVMVGSVNQDTSTRPAPCQSEYCS